MKINRFSLEEKGLKEGKKYERSGQENQDKKEESDKEKLAQAITMSLAAPVSELPPTFICPESVTRLEQRGSISKE